MNEREREIEARVNAATPGTWYWAEGSTEPRELLSQVEGDPFPQDVLWANNINPIRFERPGNQEFIAAAPADIRYLLARISELEAENAALRTNEDNAIRAYKQRDKWIWKLEEKLNEYHTALTPFAEVGAQVNTCPTYPPEQVVMRVGEAAFTVAHLLAAAAVVGVTAEAVTGGSVGTGISEIMEDSK